MIDTQRLFAYFDLLTQVVTFMLGVWLIVWSATVDGNSATTMVTGIILLVLVMAQMFLRAKLRQWSRPLTPPPPAPEAN
jgi:hypothetical protein